jgi:hypothetical protein
MTCITTKKDIFIHLFQNIINMPCGILKIVPRHNFEPSLIIIMNDGDQYFEKKIIFMSTNLHSATCQNLING